MKKLIKSAQENRSMVYEAMKSKKGYNPKKFDRKLYEETATELGVFAFGKVVGTYEETDTKTNSKANTTKVSKTARGSSKKPSPKAKTLEERVDALESKLDLILAKLG